MSKDATVQRIRKALTDNVGFFADDDYRDDGPASLALAEEIFAIVASSPDALIAEAAAALTLIRRFIEGEPIANAIIVPSDPVTETTFAQFIDDVLTRLRAQAEGGRG